MKSQAVESITKEVRVPLTPEAAFRLFTEGMSTWWPLDSHSVSGARARSVVCDGRPEGRIYEVEDDGTGHLWATIRRPGAAASKNWPATSRPRLTTCKGRIMSSYRRLANQTAWRKSEFPHSTRGSSRLSPGGFSFTCTGEASGAPSGF